MSTYYTYAYLREDLTPYYIGKGKGSRIITPHRIPVPPKDRILILKKNLTEEEAFKHEIYMIAVFGRKDLGTGILRNLTNGGEGTSGRKHTQEAIDKMSAAATGHKNPMFGKRGPDNPLFRRPPTVKQIEQGRKHSERMTGRRSLMKGSKCWNNGERNKLAFECPGEGWVLGMLRRP